LLVATIVALTALAAMKAWIPLNWVDGLLHAQRALELDVTGTPVWLSGWSFGDGQVFAVIADDPTGRQAGSLLADPAYRYLRPGFGWMVAAVTLGRDWLIPHGLFLVGLGGIVGLYLLACRLRDQLGPSAWILVLNPAIYIALAGGTAESVGALALAMTIWSGSTGWAVVTALVRPTYTIGLLGRRTFVVAATSATVMLALVMWRFGWVPAQFVGKLTMPLLGFRAEPSLLGGVVLGAGLYTLVRGVRARDLGWIGAGMLALCLVPETFADPVDAIRAAGLIPVLWAFGTRYMPERKVLSTRSLAVPAAR
jgi:hypothetical protein